MPGPQRAFYTAQELADMFGVVRRTVYVWMDTGLLPYTKAGPKLRYVTVAQLDTFLANSGRPMPSKKTASKPVAVNPSVPSADEPEAAGVGVQARAVVGSPTKKKPARRR